jgi:hypothetical protein
MPVKRKKSNASAEVQKADKALAILKPIFSKVGWSVNQGFSLCMFSLKHSPIYISLCYSWTKEFIETDPSPKSANYKQNGILDRESYRRDSAAWSARRQIWFSDKLRVIEQEIKSVCAKNGWRFRTAGTELRIDL